MMGRIDKRAQVEGPAAIDRELARIAPAVERAATSLTWVT